MKHYNSRPNACRKIRTFGAISCSLPQQGSTIDLSDIQACLLGYTAQLGHTQKDFSRHLLHYNFHPKKVCNKIAVCVFNARIGLEPPTYGLEIRCSILLSHRQVFEAYIEASKFLTSLRSLRNTPGHLMFLLELDNLFNLSFLIAKISVCVMIYFSLILNVQSLIFSISSFVISTVTTLELILFNS